MDILGSKPNPYSSEIMKSTVSSPRPSPEKDDTEISPSRANIDSTLSISGRARMLSRLFRTEDVNAKPKIEYTATTSNTSGSVFSFLNTKDREVISRAYEYAESKGINSLQVDQLAFDWAVYRMSGGSPDTTGRQFYPDGSPFIAQFTPEDTSMAKKILTSTAINDSAIDRGFLLEVLNPGKSSTHAVDFSFLEKIVSEFSPSYMSEKQMQKNNPSFLAEKNTIVLPEKKLRSDITAVIERLDFILDEETAAEMMSSRKAQSPPNFIENLSERDKVVLKSIYEYSLRYDLSTTNFIKYTDALNAYRIIQNDKLLSIYNDLTEYAQSKRGDNTEFLLDDFALRLIKTNTVNF